MDVDRGDALRRLRRQRPSEFPRIALFLFDCADAAALQGALERLPDSAAEWLASVVVMADDSARVTSQALREAASGWPLEVHREPRPSGFGSSRKAAFEYATRRGLDHIVVMRADGRHPPERLDEVAHALVVDEQPFVLVARKRRPRPGRAAGALRAAGARLQNALLGLRLRDPHTTFRAYAVRALRRVPFQLDSDAETFDAELAIQLRALGIDGFEVESGESWVEGADDKRELLLVRRALWTALDYRLHQLHVTRRGRYLVDRDVAYTLKLSETSSHMQIVDAIRPGSHVLDLGCSQGVLARPLLQKQVSVTGVDVEPTAKTHELKEYLQADLEQPLALPLGREFDYVVVADVIEHLRNRTELLRSARRYLKAGGRLIISTPNVALWFYRLSLLVGRFEYGPRGVLDRTHVHLFTRDTFRRQVERAGYHIVAERVTALPFEVVLESTGRSRAVRLLSRIYHRLARLWPEMFAYQFILEATITTLDEEATSS